VAIATGKRTNIHAFGIDFEAGGRGKLCCLHDLQLAGRGRGDSACSRTTPVDVLLLATDMDVARDFYHDKIGLDIIRESPPRTSRSSAGGTAI